jgi:hypothetical protein
MNNGEIIVKCCKCHRVCIHGDWKDVTPGDSEGWVYSHSYCPACLAEVHAEIEVTDLFTSA